ncbi:MAG: hypothetical protein ACRDV3_12315 [Acidothermaceae bacterium]
MNCSGILRTAGMLTALTSAAVVGVAASPAAFAATSTSSGSTSSGPTTLGTTSTTPAPSTPDMDNCSAGRLPAVIEGSPATYHAGNAHGAWIWHGKSGYAIRVTHPQDGHLVEFTGTVTATQPIRVKSVQLEANDHYWLSADHKTLYFDFANKGYTDGIDFVANCASRVSFNVRADGAEITPAKVHLGAQAVAALSNPFTVERRK